MFKKYDKGGRGQKFRSEWVKIGAFLLMDSQLKIIAPLKIMPCFKIMTTYSYIAVRFMITFQN